MTNLFGCLVKPFHRPECVCERCVEWLQMTVMEQHGEIVALKADNDRLVSGVSFLASAEVDAQSKACSSDQEASRLRGERDAAREERDKLFCMIATVRDEWDIRLPRECEGDMFFE